jgi:GTPase SAR1 family protein
MIPVEKYEEFLKDLYEKPVLKVLLLGLDGSGKTRMLYKLHLNEDI